MMNKLKIITAFIMLITVTVILSGCANRPAELIISSDTYVYVPAVDPAAHTIGEVTAIPQTDVALPRIDPIIEITDPPETTAAVPDTVVYGDTVYWTKSGEVWHVKRNCSSLAKSKEVLSGTVSQAIENGKDRVCKRCSG